MSAEEKGPGVRWRELAGAWRLLSWEARNATGDVWQEDLVGMLLYDSAGYVAMVYMRRDRPRFASGDPLGGTPQELKAAFEGFDAYCGTYTLDEAAGVVTHHLHASRFPNWEGTDQVRHVELDGARLRIITPPIFIRGVEWTIYLSWERAPELALPSEP